MYIRVCMYTFINVPKIWEYRLIREVLLSNIFFCKNFCFDFINKLLIKKISA